ncbi:unnamed protein product [Effrenium voratum]|nr:unnamed protein product [Effrenium voratum]
MFECICALWAWIVAKVGMLCGCAEHCAGSILHFFMNMCTNFAHCLKRMLAGFPGCCDGVVHEVAHFCNWLGDLFESIFSSILHIFKEMCMGMSRCCKTSTGKVEACFASIFGGFVPVLGCRNCEMREQSEDTQDLLDSDSA